jgi:hypothetical protein
MVWLDWNRTSDLFGVKAASGVYLVPARHVLCVVTWAYVLGGMS